VLYLALVVEWELVLDRCDRCERPDRPEALEKVDEVTLAVDGTGEGGRGFFALFLTTVQLSSSMFVGRIIISRLS